MGRRRQNNPLGLPARVYRRHGAFFYVDRAHRWHNLGAEWNIEARRRWADLSGEKAASGTVSELLELYLIHVAERVKKGEASTRTLADNEAEVRNLKRSFGWYPVPKLTSDLVASYLDAALEARRGVRANREIACLSSAYSLIAMRKRWVRTNPCYGVRRNPESAREHYVEGQDLRRFAKRYAPRWLRLYCLLKHLTGLRQGDMLRLTLHNLTDRGIELRTGKTGKRMRFAWTWALRIVVQHIKALPAQRTALPTPIHLFTTGGNTPMTARGFKSAWQRAMLRFAKDGHARFWENDIRAKTASDAPSEQRAQELLGHTNVSTTKRHYRRGWAKVRPLR